MPDHIPLPGFVARLRSLWRGLARRDDIEKEMDDEFRHHLQMRTDDLVRRGLARDAAVRQARIEFGGIDGHKEDGRASRGLRFFDEIRFSGLDAKLGLRMLLKYRGLSIVSVLGMSVAITIGAITFAVLATLTNPALPLADGDRVVSLRNWDIRANSPNPRVMHDFLLWKSELRSIGDLGAFSADHRNLIVPGVTPQLVRVAEMTASGFRVARVAPMLGRPLLEEDERPGAPPVIVIGHDEWQRRFGSDPGILGRTVRLGNAVHTVVGVMPAGFRFPINHEYWVPLRVATLDYGRGGGPSLFVFGRLADGVSLDVAQTELTTIGLRAAAAFPETNENLRPRITPYAYPFLGIDSPQGRLMIASVRAAISLLLLLIAVNVAILIYARTATRTGEIAVRTALGASRRRIVTQLFVEALVISTVAAAVGLAVTSVVLSSTPEFLWPGRLGEFPFWIDFTPSAELVWYAAGLAVATAAVVGVLPALKVTGPRVQVSLQHLTGRGSQMRLGRTWTVLIVGQVAVAVAMLPFAVFESGQLFIRAGAEASYAADELLRARLLVERGDVAPNADSGAIATATQARFAAGATELFRRLENEHAVTGVTFVSYLPGYPFARVEVEGGDVDWAFINRVDTDHFEVFGIPVLGGRPFADADARGAARSVVVNRVFAERMFGGGSAIGRRVRYVSEGTDANRAEKGPWLEVVGVVPDFTVQGDLEPPHARLYEPLAPNAVAPGITLSVRVRGAHGSSFAQRFMEVAAEVDPTLQLRDVQTAADAERGARRGLGLIAAAITAVVVSVLLLSAAGIYAMMSFTVARRRREIGIRSALGANPRRLLAGIFARATGQLGAGVVIGLLIAFLVRGPVDGKGMILLPFVAALMIVVGLLAAIGPARRGLAIPPTEALRDD